jgi:hypothetical protein
MEIAVMVLLLAATLVGSGITLAVLWPLGLQIASAPLGGSLVTAVAAISLVIRNSRLMQAEGPTSVAHGRPHPQPDWASPFGITGRDRCWIAAYRTAPACSGLSVRLFGRWKLSS